MPEFLAKAQQTHGLYVNSVAFLPCAEHRHRSPYLRGFYNQLHKPAITGALIDIVDNGGGSGDGVFSSTASWVCGVASGESGRKAANYYFSAKSSSAVYAGTSVQPASILALVAIRY